MPSDSHYDFGCRTKKYQESFFCIMIRIIFSNIASKFNELMICTEDKVD